VRPSPDRSATESRPHCDRSATESRPQWDRVPTAVRLSPDRSATAVRPSPDRSATEFRPRHTHIPYSVASDCNHSKLLGTSRSLVTVVPPGRAIAASSAREGERVSVEKVLETLRHDIKGWRLWLRTTPYQSA